MNIAMTARTQYEPDPSAEIDALLELATGGEVEAGEILADALCGERLNDLERQAYTALVARAVRGNAPEALGHLVLQQINRHIEAVALERLNEHAAS